MSGETVCSSLRINCAKYYNKKLNLRQTHQLYLILCEWLHVSTPTGSSSGLILNQVNETLTWFKEKPDDDPVGVETCSHSHKIK